MRLPVTRLRRLPLTPRAIGGLVVTAAFAMLLLARGSTVTLDCVSALVPPALAETAALGRMPMVDWFASHPARGLNATAAPADSFVAANSCFDEADDPASVVDTAKIVQGDIVLCKWISGSHSISSGSGSADPSAGLLFDQPMSSLSKTFSFQFNAVGTFPFFCRNHELSGMSGIVVVSQNLAGVGPARAAGGDGFVRSPWPNPARGTSTFRFAMARPGRARVSVLDAQGRRVATPLDGDLAAGTFESHWSGRTAGGSAAPAGVYFVRLDLAAHTQTRRITLVH